MVSLTPGTPGTTEHMPRMMRSMGTPAWLASYSAAMMPGSTMELTLITMRPSPCVRCRSVSAAMSSRMPDRRLTGATSSRR